MAQASRESVAYQLDTVQKSSRSASNAAKPARMSRPQKQSRSASTISGMKKMPLVTPARIFCAIFVAIVCVGVIYSQMMLTMTTHALSDCKEQMKVLASEHVFLMSKYEQKYNADYIAEYAENTLGMVKLNAGQIEYIELSNPNQIEVSDSAANAGGVVGSLVRGFTSFLEYLR